MARVTVKFFATVREIVGQRSVETDADTIRDLLDQLTKTYGRRFSDTVIDAETGGLRRFYSCMVNGRRIELLNGLDTQLSDNDAVALFPPVGGG